MNKPQLQLPIEEFYPGPRPTVWRPINYLGSKLRLIEPLRLAIDRADPSGAPVVDLFSGSGTVSAALSTNRDVIAVDIQEYSRVLCSAILQPPDVSDSKVHEFLIRSQGSRNHARLSEAAPLIDYEQFCLGEARHGYFEPICDLIDHASIVAFHGHDRPAVQRRLETAHQNTLGALTNKMVVLRHFGGLYFSYKQAVELDLLLLEAHAEDDEVRDFFLAAIISTASEIVNTVGKHFAQPIRPRGSDGKPKRHLITKIIRDRELEVGPIFLTWLDRYRSFRRTGRKHSVIRRDYVGALENLGRNIGVVYADPPYTRDHYSRFYHVLETMSLMDDPGVSTTRIHAAKETFSRGMYRRDRHQSPFCIKSQVVGAFEGLFSAIRDLKVPLVLSYSPYSAATNSHPRVITVEQLTALTAKYFARVEKLSAGKFSHMKLNTTRLHLDASEEAEFIFICS